MKDKTKHPHVAGKQSLSISQVSITASVHISVGVAVVVISSFVNSEMKFNGWEPSIISFFLGIPIIFELFRIYFGHLYDNNNILRSTYFFGLIFSFLGIFFLPQSILPVGNFLVFINISLFYFGSAIMTTLTDSYLTDFSTEETRGNVAGILQFFRLLGFAIGGFIGSLLYSRLDFTIFIRLLSIFYALFALLSFFSFRSLHKPKKEGVTFIASLKELKNLLVFSKEVYLMTIFLLLFPIGLFMQDLILEPFAISQFQFTKENVGSIVALWTSLTLLFVPIGVFVEKISTPLIPITGGEILAALGLLGFAITPLISSIQLFYIALISFGIGNGLASAPAIRLMLDVCSFNKANLALLLGFFGILITVGRSLASVLGGVILVITDNNFSTLFFIEMSAAFLTLPPILALTRHFDTVKKNEQNEIFQNSLMLD